MNEWQIAVSIGQLIGTVGALIWFTRGLKADFQKFQDEHNKQLEKMKEKHDKLREELLRDYLRKDEFIVLNNKLEATMKEKFDELKELILTLTDRR